MAELRYGQVEGSGHGREYPVAASQYFHRRGGKFVDIASGNISLCASDSASVFGWVDSPKHAAGTDSYLSSSTAGKDKLFVVYDLDAVFEIPYYTTVTTSLIGDDMGIINMGTAGKNQSVTATSVQVGKVGSSNEVLQCVDVDIANQTVFVKVVPEKRQ